MEYNVSQYFSGILVVSAQLGAAIVVVPGEDRVNALSVGFRLQSFHEFLGNAVDAPDSGDDPNFIAGPCFSVGALVAHECPLS